MKYRRPPEKNRPSPRPQQQQQPQRSSLWVGLILFVSAWVFLLGVLVGRKTAPILFDYRKINTEIAELAKTASEKKLAQKKGSSDPLAKLDDLDFYEKLKEKTSDIPELQLPLPEKASNVEDIPKNLARKPEPEHAAGNTSVKSPETAMADAHPLEPPPITQETAKNENPVEHKPEKPVEHKPETRVEHKSEAPPHPPLERVRQPEAQPVERKPEIPPHPPLQRVRQPELVEQHKPDSAAHTAATQATATGYREVQAEHKPEHVERPLEAAKTEPQRIRSAYDLMKPQPAREAVATAEPHTTTPEPGASRPSVATHSPSAEAKPPVRTPVKPPVKQPQPEKKVTLQASSLTDRKSADDQVAALRKKGIYAWKVAKMVPGKGVWYQVVVGKYGAAQADAIKSRLKQDNVDVSTTNP